MYDYVYLENETWIEIYQFVVENVYEFSSIIREEKSFDECTKILLSPPRIPVRTSREDYILFDMNTKMFKTKKSGQRIRISKLLKWITGEEDPDIIKTYKGRFLFQLGIISTESVKVGLPTEIYDRIHVFNSCMKYRGEFYKFLEREAGLRVAYIEDHGGRVVARALVWKNVFDTEGRAWTVVDRIYASEDIYKDIIMRWGLENGYAVKDKVKVIQGEVTDFVTNEGRVSLELYIKIPPPYDEPLPYLDTFSYMYQDMFDEHVYLSIREDIGYQLHAHLLGECNSTEGYHPLNLLPCSICGDGVSDDDVVYVGDDRVCPVCLDGYYVFSEIVGDFIYRDDAVRCAECGEWEDSWRATPIFETYFDDDKEDEYVCRNCVVRFNVGKALDGYYREEIFATRIPEKVGRCNKHDIIYIEVCPRCMMEVSHNV